MVFHTGNNYVGTTDHQQFAIVRELEIDFQNGMTVITGETGAGKSIAIDALGLCLGGAQTPTWYVQAPREPTSTPASP